METKKNDIKKTAFYAALLIILYWGLHNYQMILEGLGTLLTYLTPVIMGCAIAFVMNVPMSFIERKMLKKYTGKKFVRPLSMVMTMLFIVAIVNTVLFIVIPEVTSSAKSLGASAQPAINDLLEKFNALRAEHPEYFTWIENFEFNWVSILNTISSIVLSGVEGVLSSTVSVLGVVFNGIVNFVVAMVFAIYILSEKEKFGIRGKLLMYSLFGKKKSDRALYIFEVTYISFAKFLSGQCTEAIIIGVLFFVTMTLFQFPYTLMISVLIAFTALIPIFGGFVGCALGAFVILIESPMMSLWFLLLFIVVQQFEGNVIYPKVVGGSLGLPPLWVLLAVSLGGNLMGLVGILIFIPIFSVCYRLIWEYVGQKNPVSSDLPYIGMETEEELALEEERYQERLKELAEIQKEEKNN